MRVSARTQAFALKLHRWQNASDSERAVYRSLSVGRLITLWERIRVCHEWTRVTDIESVSRSEQRWIKRQLHYLEHAGRVERRIVTKMTTDRLSTRETEFRVIR